MSNAVSTSLSRPAGSILDPALPIPEDLAGALLIAIVESADDAIISKDLSGTITSWNRAAERIFGYPPHEIIGLSVLKLIPTELHSEEARILATVRRGDRVDHLVTTRLRKDGTLIEISLTVSPIKDPTGRVVGASKVVRDITAEKKHSDATRLLAAIVDSSDDAIISKSLQGVITSWNRSAERIFGYTALEAVGRHITLLIPEERWDEEPQILARLQRGERERSAGTRMGNSSIFHSRSRPCGLARASSSEHPKSPATSASGGSRSGRWKRRGLNSPA